MKVAIYARVSTDTTDKQDKRQDPETQLLELRDYCKRQGWEWVEFVDRVSGATGKKRPQFEQMLEEARLRKVDVVLVWKIDRFARSMIDFVNYTLQLDLWGVRFISLTQGIDTDKQNPTSRLLMHLLAAMAEFERELIRERIIAGIARVESKGRKWNSWRKKYNILDVEKAQKLHEAGTSIRNIARILGLSKSLVHVMLTSVKEAREEREIEEMEEEEV